MRTRKRRKIVVRSVRSYIYRKGGEREVLSLAQRRVSLIHVLLLSPLPKTNISKFSLDQERGCATSKSLFIFC